ncbi:MAG: DUF4271 domain-containing protein [Marinilabiliales bacterium]|nr:DUF4271 domain-containing protein [Marinilabiliales bacterium]
MSASPYFFMPVGNTKTSQPSRKGVTANVQKGAKKETQKESRSEKPAPVKSKLSADEESILKAAERYHQQISGKSQPRKEAVNTAYPAEKRHQESVTSKAVVLKKGNQERNFRHGGQESRQATEESEQTLNIYTGNPGIYKTEGDTLNLWSLTPVPVDSLATQKVVTVSSDKPYGFEGKPMKTTSQDWTFFLVLVGWTVFASLRFGFSKYMVQVFQSVFNYGAASRLYRERGYANNFGMFRLNLVFYLFLPFASYLIARDNGMATPDFAGLEFYFIVFVVINGYFMVKIFLYKLLGSIFSQKDSTGELVFNMMLYHNVLGLILLPVATVHALVPGFGMVSLFIVPSLILIFYLLSLIRSIYFAVRVGISIFYLILYLCALEILPILLVIKLATGA